MSICMVIGIISLFQRTIAESVCEKEDAPKFEDASDGGDTE